MQLHRLWIPATLSLVFAACAADPMNESDTELDTETTALSGAAKPTTGYFSARRDVRRCAAPLCGGYFVASVNEVSTRCADGTFAAECYVATLDLPRGVEVEEGDLLHGNIVEPRHSKKKKPKLPGFVADFVVSPVLDTPSAGPFFLAFDTGVRCITTPCPSTGLTALNTGTAESTTGFEFRNETVESAFFDELGTDADAGTGAITVGTVGKGHGRGKKGRKSVFQVQNVYVTKGR